MQISAVDERSVLSINKINNDENTVGTIDGVIIGALSNRISDMQKVKDQIISSLNNPILISDPAALQKVQAMIADYQVTIELVSKVAQSAVRTVDTLVKS